MISAKFWAIGAVIVIMGVVATILMVGAERYQDGKTAAESACKSQQNAELIAANAEIVRLTDKARRDEADHAAALVSASQTYQEALKNEKTVHDRTVSDLRSGALRLRIDIARRESSGNGSAAQAGASPGRCDGATTAELSQPAAEFLVGLASDADEVAHQLTACQAVVTADRQIQGEQ